MKYYVEVTEDCTYWYKDSLMTVHREDGPAVIWSDGTKHWYKNGFLHREDGPAIEYRNGAKYWYLNGKKYTEEEFNEKMNPVTELTVADIEKLLGKKVKIVR